MRGEKTKTKQFKKKKIVKRLEEHSLTSVTLNFKNKKAKNIFF